MEKWAKIIAVDFDGTLFTNKWPDIGKPIQKNIKRLKEEQAAGARSILWTNRTGSYLQAAIKACSEQGIVFDKVNENLPEIIEAFGSESRKIFADEYWDDKAVLMSEKDIGEFSDLDNKKIYDYVIDDIEMTNLAFFQMKINQVLDGLINSVSSTFPQKTTDEILKEVKRLSSAIGNKNALPEGDPCKYCQNLETVGTGPCTGHGYQETYLQAPQKRYRG